MAKSKKSTSKKDEGKPEDVPANLAEEIQEVVSMEDKPSKQLRTKKIPITHWEENVETNETDSFPVKTSISIEVPDDDEEVDTLDALEVATAETDTDEASEEETTDVDEDEWHKIEISELSDESAEEDSKDEAVTTDNADSVTVATSSEEEAERPEWDDEKWQQANADEEEAERPEWDDEKWQQANKDEDDDEEHPDWDDEKWNASDEASEVAVATEVGESEANDQAKTEVSVVAEEKEERESVDAEKPESSTSVLEDEDEDPDHLSAAQLAISSDDAFSKKQTSNKFNPKRFVTGFATWWKSAKLRNSAIVSFALLLLVFVTVPNPRYAMLNTVGVRATASVSVVDAETQLPLKEVKVTLAGQEDLTDENGQATFEGVKLGIQMMQIEKSAYDIYTKSLTVGMGSNSIDTVQLEAIGSSFQFQITDWLTNEAVSGAEVRYETNSAFVDEEGLAKLVTPSLIESSIIVTASAPGYVDKEIEISTTTSDINPVSLVLDRYHLYISRRDGKFDVYKSLPDGSDEQLVLSATGNERADLRFDTSPSGEKSVLVATRDKNIKNEDNFILSGLYLIDTQNGSLQKIDSSERIDIVGWIGERVIFVKVQAGASGRNPQRHRLMSLNTRTAQLNEIAASNYFNDVIVAKDYIFYAPSDAYKQNPKPYLFRSNADGSNIETVFEKVVWTVLRTGYNEIQFDSEQVWYKGEIDRIFNIELDARPTSFTSRLYTPSPSASKSAWVDIRDGKGSLVIADTQTGEEEILLNQGGLRNPIVWLSEKHLIFRVVTSTETADYVININGGDPQKIRDVTDVSGADRWYYYY